MRICGEGIVLMEFITNRYLSECVGNNTARLMGKVLTEPVFNHKTYGKAYYILLLGVLRKSGYEDKIRLMISETILAGKSPRMGEILEVDGQIRTYNIEEKGRNKLEVLLFVRTMKYVRKREAAYENKIDIVGFICKKPIRRTSPLGREICDLMIAVNRPYNKSDYIPAIAWGKLAAEGEKLHIGERVYISGRIQSRDYKKITDTGNHIIKTAYEVSVVDLVTDR